MKRYFAFAVTILFLALHALQGQQQSTDVLLSKARSLEGRGRTDLAAEAWQRVLLTDPKQPEALAGMARYSKQQGLLEDARKYLDRLRAVDPKHAGIAQAESTQVISQHRARLQEAARLAANNQPAAAMSIYRDVFGTEPLPGAWAIAYYETDAATPGGWDRAVAALQKLTVAYAGASEYKVSLGKLLTYRPDSRARGIRLLEEVKGEDAAVARAKEAWRQALLWDGPKASNAATIRTYLSRYSDPELQKLAAQIPAAEGGRHGLAQTKEEIQAYETLNAGNLDLAATQFSAILRAAPQNVAALAGMGYVRMRRRDFGGAVDDFEAARAGAPDNRILSEAAADARFWKTLNDGNRAVEEKKIGEAEALYENALEQRPDSVEAMQGLAGAYVRSGKAAQALPLYEKVARANPKDAVVWRSLVIATREASGAKAAIEAANRIPTAVQLALAKDVELPALLAGAHAELGHVEQANRLMTETLELAAAEKITLPVPIQLQFGGLQLKYNRPSQAEALYRSAVESEPANITAVEGLAAALVRQGKEADAFQLMQGMPKKAFDEALKSKGFLRVAAAVQAKFGKVDVAEELLRRVLDVETEPGSQLSTQVQLASIWLQQGQYAKAQRLLGQLADSNSDNEEVWKMLLASFANAQRHKQGAETMSRISKSVMAKLQDDTGFLSIAAAIRSGVGEQAEALELVRAIVVRLQQDNESVPADVNMQLAWLLLNTRADEAQLYDTLVRLSRERRLTAAQKTDYNEIWLLWSLRRAGEARDSGDYGRAVSILEAVAQLVPKDDRLVAALGGVYLASGDSARALRAYRSWGLAGGQPYDYTSAVSAAIAQKDAIAWKWIEEGLRVYPRSPEILNLAGKLAAQKGDYKQAEAYWRSAMAASQYKDAPNAQRPGGNPLPALAPGQPGLSPKDSAPDPVKSLGPLLIGRAERQDEPASMTPAVRTAVATVREERRDLPARSQGIISTAAWEDRPVQRSPKLPPAPADEDSVRLPAMDALAPELRVKTPLQKELQEQLHAVQSRNTPYLGATTRVEGRNGRQGFEQRVLQEAEFETSTVIGDRVRATLIARPTFITTGAADGSSTVRFGLLPKGAAFDAMTASGLGAEAQVSTETLGLRFGSTPRGFLVQNFIGSLRFRPAGGPITVIVSRDPLKDTMLSYAGAKDPVTGQIFGGVIADSASVQGNWSGAQSGFYVSGGYQRLTGHSVERNSRMDGTIGGYWRLMSRPEGDLTAGFTIFGMSYQKNLRYFTVGQGGYFSPQRYLLFGVPINFRGQRGRVQYDIAGTIGSQSFREDSSSYFPLTRALQLASGLVYAGQSVTSVNFSFDSQVQYRLSPNWQFVVFANTNNARNFTTASIGASIRYTLRPSPLSPMPYERSVPDWRGAQPLERRYF